ncbi:hypothetical protein LXL04_009845 [Taraxacum kok-saghyz]
MSFGMMSMDDDEWLPFDNDRPRTFLANSFEALGIFNNFFPTLKRKNLFIVVAYRQVQELLDEDKKRKKNDAIPALKPLIWTISFTRLGPSFTYDATSMNELTKWNGQYGELKKCGTNLQESHIPDLMQFFFLKPYSIAVLLLCFSSSSLKPFNGACHLQCFASDQATHQPFNGLLAAPVGNRGPLQYPPGIRPGDPTTESLINKRLNLNHELTSLFVQWSSQPNNLPLEGLWTNCPQAALRTFQTCSSLPLESSLGISSEIRTNFNNCHFQNCRYH